METKESVDIPMTCVDCPDEEELELANEVRGRVTSKPLKHESKLERDRVTRIRDEYQREIDESDGFDVGDYRDKLPPGFTGGMIFPADGSKEELAEDFNGHALSAIELYNNKMGAKFKFVEVEKACCNYMSYHITFTAREDENDEPIVFQALVANRVKGEIVTLCRQKGKPNEAYNEGDEYESDEDEEEAEDCSEDEEEAEDRSKDEER